MRFAVLLPWWGYVLAFAAVFLLAWLTYARLTLSLTVRQRALLTGLRAVTLLLIVAVLLRPVIFVQATEASDSVVAILVDVSRSMRIADAGTSAGTSTRIAHAAVIVRNLQQQLGSSFRVELITFGESVAKGDV